MSEVLWDVVRRVASLEMALGIVQDSHNAMSERMDRIEGGRPAVVLATPVDDASPLSTGQSKKRSKRSKKSKRRSKKPKKSKNRRRR